MNQPKPRGTPTKLTPERQAKILQAIEAGSYLNVACAYAGVSYKVFREWMIKGESAKSGIYRDFRDAVELSEAKAEIRMVGQWQTQAKDDWRAAAEYLARRFPDRWASTQKIRVEVEKQVEQEFNMFFESVLSDDSLSPEAKKRILQIADNLESSAAKAGAN